ncbi:MAG: hypothetical protein GY799_05375 [Desulfobulbaceae bacterium]|nr:hypothetical protein [Desulfobulbaceae bacterium]
MSQPFEYTFLPYLRRGIATGITQEENEDAETELHPAIDLKLRFNVNGAGENRDASTRIVLFGPGEVAGINHRIIARTYPAPDVRDAEPNYFPLIEFNQADFPWRFSPYNAPDHRLRPWLVLIVLTNLEIAATEPAGADGRLPSIKVDTQYLPKLDQSWAWAHAQVAGLTADENVADILQNAPERMIARLLSPRRLEPVTVYSAFLVPSFEGGRCAGLKREVDSSTGPLERAWHGETATVELPVYYQWQFQTGEKGDFQSLAQKLLPPKFLPVTVGKRNMDVSHPGGKLPRAADVAVGLEGALMSPACRQANDVVTQNTRFVDRLIELLNGPTAVLDGGETRTVTPPLYGRWHAACDRIEKSSPAWFKELNTDVRLRTMAGLGTRVIQDQQQQIMAAAWEQIEELVEHNEKISQAQLAVAVSERIYERHFKTQDVDALFFTTAPLHSHIISNAVTIEEHLRQSSVHNGLLEGPYRRINRLQGPVRKRQQSVTVESAYQHALKMQEEGPTDGQQAEVTPFSGSLVTKMGGGSTSLPKGGAPQTQSINVNSVVDIIISKTQSKEGRKQLEAFKQGILPAKEIVQDWNFVESGKPGESYYEKDSLKITTSSLDNMAKSQQMIPTASEPAPQPMDENEIDALKDVLLEAINPRSTVIQALTGDASNASEPVMAAPRFDYPMYAPLRDLSKEWLLPGAANIPPNTVSTLETNQRFIEAFMVGLNHEMARELLWREYPTDQRGTCFRQFWDVRGYTNSQPASENLQDITFIHEWCSELGQHRKRVEEQLVLVIRGDLFRRFPNTIIYANEAVLHSHAPGKRTLGEKRKDPIFFGRLEPDIYFWGFDLPPESIRGREIPGDLTHPDESEGWFFVLAQHPGELLFGLNDTDGDYGRSVGSWEELSWRHLVKKAIAMDDMVYIDLRNDLPALTNGLEDNPLAWHLPADPGEALSDSHPHASDMACITLQKPFRVAIHGSDMLPPDLGEADE